MSHIEAECIIRNQKIRQISSDRPELDSWKIIIKKSLTASDYKAYKTTHRCMDLIQKASADLLRCYVVL